MATAKTSVPAPTPAPAKSNAEDMVTIKLPITRGLNEDRFVSVNDKTYQIKRGIPVSVPASVAEVLAESDRATVEAIEFENSAKNFDGKK